MRLTDWKTLYEQRIGKKTFGFGADIKNREEKNIGEILSQVQPEDLTRYGLIPEFVGRLPGGCNA